MLFNSIDFVVFLPLVFILYWFVFNKNLKLQNALLVAASYVFYGWWDWRFLSLILFSTLIDFFVGIGLGKEENQGKRKILLWTSILVNLGFLGFFKYFNFFLDNFVEAFTLMGMPFETRALSIVLPVGISFYTFQTLSYSIDVYRRKLEPTRDFISFAAFVSFFPQLVAGPIERATHLLPQFYKDRTFNRNQAVDGLRQILWGFFKKLVIADNCAEYANLIFNNSADYNGSTLVLGALFFAFQIYGDFSGYSDIAIGTSRLFGFNLTKNFAFPYFSRDIAEFWRRWHISLSTWFRDYLYIPLGGSHGGNWMKIRNTIIIFVVSGFWHGANWTFVVWGALHALYFMPLILFNQNRKNIEVVAQGKLAASLSDIFKISLTFALTLIAYVFFRAENIGHAFSYLTEIFSKSILELPEEILLKSSFLTICLLVAFIFLEWLGREQEFAIEKMGFSWPQKVRWLFYTAILFAIVMFMQTEEVPFIYFQF